MINNQCKWWRNSTIYEIYPNSFMDSNGDKIGDINGIISKLDYLSELNIDAIWLCPIFESPFRDGGYDISDYYNINPKFGTMADFERLISTAHQKNIKVILDMVINHTSDQHPWFLSAKQSKSSKYRDYYIFRDVRNNWISSRTLESVWTANAKTDDNYLHIYTKYQPDLNWESEILRKEIHNILRFWLEKGIDGYRFDVINKIAKAEKLPDLKETLKHSYADHLFENQDRVHEYIREMHEKVFEDYPDVLIMGQTNGIDQKQAMDYAHPSRKELDLYLQFDHIDIDKGHEGRRKSWTVKELKSYVFKWQELSKDEIWPTVFFGSHDITRMVEHYGNVSKKYYKISAKMLAALQLCLLGTQIIYMGDELALKNVDYKTIDEFNDIRSHSIYNKRITDGEDKNVILDDLRFISRDNARYPIPWDMADEMQDDQTSILTFYKQIIAYRKSEMTLLYGDCTSIYDDIKGLFAYERKLDNIIITVLANMTENVIELDMRNIGDRTEHGNYDLITEFNLQAYEVRIYRLEI